MRKIIHVDMDAFFASVEQRDQPELRGKPIAVGGGGSRGVVASASYEARTFGVRSAMPGAVALRLCPGLIFVRHRFEVYKQVSQQIKSIFFEYTDLVEPLSLDEAFLDVTTNKKEIESAIRIAMEIRKRIQEETQLTASAGVSFNKFLAKIASDINKPDGFKVILPEEAEGFLEQLPVKKFHGIGKVTAERMHRMGIFTGRDLKQFEERELLRLFGKAGRHFFRMVRAQDDRPVKPLRIRKSIGAERTFSKDLRTLHEMKLQLQPIIKKVYEAVERSNNFGRTMTLKMKRPDFQILTRSRSFNDMIREREVFFRVANELLESHYEEAGAVRLLGISISNLMSEQEGYGKQLQFDFNQEES